MSLRVWANSVRRFKFMVKLTCVYIGVISDLAGGIREEEIDLTGGNPTARVLIEILGKRHRRFKDTYIDPETLRLNPRRQVLVTPPNGRTLPLGALQGLDTKMDQGFRVVFW
jgi:hypothetical protein